VYRATPETAQGFVSDLMALATAFESLRAVDAGLRRRSRGRRAMKYPDKAFLRYLRGRSRRA